MFSLYFAFRSIGVETPVKLSVSMNLIVIMTIHRVCVECYG